MRAGETDKSVSVKDAKLFGLIKKFVESVGFCGIIDIDIFKVDGTYYISEVNPASAAAIPMRMPAASMCPRRLSVIWRERPMRRISAITKKISA